MAAEHLAAGRPADAVEALTRLVESAPTYAAAHVLQAVALEAAGQSGPALAAWHRAALLVPRSPLVVRERARLMAMPPDGGAPAEASEPPAPEPEAPAAEAWPAAEVPEPVPLGAIEPDAIQPDAILPDEPTDDDAPLFETLPLDDLATALSPDMPGDDDFDPDAFDFSAFALDDDDAGWLLGQDDALPDAATAPDETLAWDDTALPPDWAEALPDDSVRLMPPEATDETTDAGPAASPAEGEWAVFEDEPTFPPVSFDDVQFEPVAPPEAPPPEAPAPAQPEPPAEAPRAPSVADELDSLIASLEDAPRIRPDPAFRGPSVGTTAADVEGLASETLARIYAAQHQYVEAAIVYETLAARDPSRAEAMLQQAAEMRRKKA